MTTKEHSCWDRRSCLFSVTFHIGRKCLHNPVIKTSLKILLIAYNINFNYRKSFRMVLDDFCWLIFQFMTLGVVESLSLVVGLETVPYLQFTILP